jgi:UDP-2-acetamido-2,6-beta-L-arabino-hexul-4-ose reductase
MKILITGSTGFIGKNLVDVLRHHPQFELLLANSQTSVKALSEWAKQADRIIHLAGYSRSRDDETVYEKNISYSEQLVSISPKTTPILFASTHASGRHNAYVASKYEEEQRLFSHFEQCRVVRLDNVFGPWARPHYNSVIATFIQGVFYNESFSLFDEHVSKTFLYVDSFTDLILSWLNHPETGLTVLEGKFTKTPAEILTMIQDIKKDIESQATILYEDPFQQHLVTVIMSVLPPSMRRQSLISHRDERGQFIEVNRSQHAGQWSLNVIEPGAQKGNHYHRIRYEKFILVSGKVTLLQRSIHSQDVTTDELTEPFQVIWIVPGVIHQLINQRDEQAVLLMWSSLLYDPDKPDTYYESIV